MATSFSWRRAPRPDVEPDRMIRSFIAGDALRGLAALWVVVFHCGASTLWLTQRPDQWTASFGYLPGVIVSGGGAGVDLFFVLSGYLIARPFTRALQSNTRLTPLRFYLPARALRVYPAFWVVLFAATVAHGTRGSGVSDMANLITLRSFDPLSPYAGELAPAWTLPLELGFYVLIPVAAMVLRVLFRAGLPAISRRAVVVAVPLLTFGIAVVLSVSGNHSNTVFAMLGFSPGVALAASVPHAPASLITPRAGRLWLGVAGVAGVALILKGAYSEALAAWGAVVPAVLAGLIVGGLLMNQRASGTCPRLLDNRVLAWLGERSYGIYIWHYMIISVTWTWALEPGAWRVTMVRLTFVVLALTIAFADLSWRWVERPALALRGYIRRDRSDDVAERTPEAGPARVQRS